jgi:hypothetical protein
MAPDQRGQNKTREEEREGEARRGKRVHRHASTTASTDHTSEQLQL